MSPLRSTYSSQLNDPLLASNNVATFTGPQNLIRLTANGAYVAQPTIIPVNYLKPGTCIRTEAFGNFSTTLTPTLVFGVYLGTTPLAVNVALTTPTGAGNLPWHMRILTIVRSAVVPSAVVTISQGELWYGTTLTAVTQLPIPGTVLAAVNVDNSVAAEWSVQATYSVSNAANAVLLSGLVIEEITQI
jgi:hypothetical protein